MPSPIRLGKLGAADLEAALQLACQGFGAALNLSQSFVQQTLRTVDPERSVALRQDGKIIGVYLIAALPFVSRRDGFRSLAALPALEDQALFIPGIPQPGSRPPASRRAASARPPAGLRLCLGRGAEGARQRRRLAQTPRRPAGPGRRPGAERSGIGGNFSLWTYRARASLPFSAQ